LKFLELITHAKEMNRQTIVYLFCSREIEKNRVWTNG